MLLTNIPAMFVRNTLTVTLSRWSNCSSASLASTHAAFAAETAATPLRTDWMNVTACAAVKLCPAAMNVAVGQYVGIPSTIALYSEIVRGLIVLLLGIGTCKRERRARWRARRNASPSSRP